MLHMNSLMKINLTDILILQWPKFCFDLLITRTSNSSLIDRLCFSARSMYTNKNKEERKIYFIWLNTDPVIK